MKNKYLKVKQINKQKKKNEIPAENYHSTETFINLVEKDINDAKNEPKKRPKQNLIKGELEAQKQLEKRQDKFISHANKGGAVVIMDTDKHIEEVDRQLSDSTKRSNITT